MKKYLGLLILAVLFVNIDVLAQSVGSHLEIDHTSPLFVPDPDDKFWDDRFTLGGPNGGINSMVIDEAGDLIVGGHFSTAGNQITRKVARWDGSSWHPVGEGLTHQGVINSLIFDEGGTLVMGGWDLTDLSRGDDILAVLEGDTWVSKGSAEWFGQALAVAIDDEGSIYAGGQVISPTDNRTHRIIKYDGASWSVLGGKVEGLTWALAVGGNETLYMGGSIESIDGLAINGIAMWDGVSWVQLGGGLREGTVYAMVTDNNGNLYVGGEFEFAGEEFVHNIAMWDGTSWTPLGNGFDGIVRSLVFDEAGALYAGGGGAGADGNYAGRVARWDGTSWSSIGETLDRSVHAVAVDQGGKVYAGGAGLIFDELASNVVMWDGGAWLPVSEGTGLGLNSGTSAIVADASCDIYVAGGFSLAGDIIVDQVVRWDNEFWAPVGSGIDGHINDLALSDDGKLYAGGWFGLVDGEVANSVTMWDGSYWLPLGEGLKTQEYPGRVYALAVDEQGNLFVGGEFDTAGGMPANNIAKWDGTSWSPLGSGVMGGKLFTRIDAMAFDGKGNLYAGGEFEIAGIVSAKNVAMWDGIAWSRLGGGLDDRDTGGRVKALTIDGNDILYIGGNFSIAGNTAVANIASWDGVAWKKLGIGFNTTVWSLEVDDNGYLYAGGQFNALGPSGFIEMNHTARWDGVEWSSLGSGVNGNVRDMALDGRGNLYLGGNMSTAGHKVSNGIARWEVRPNDSSSCAERPAPNQQPHVLTSYYPNPFMEFATIGITVTEPQHLTVNVYDGSARFIEQLFVGQTLAYQLRRFRFEGASLASGTYFVRIEGEFFSQMQAVTFLK